MAVIPREASTVVLLKDRFSHDNGIEVLLVVRDKSANFAAGAHVFPGGMLEENDYSPQALALSPRFNSQAALDVMQGVESSEKAHGLHIAAIRETFEETGALLARETDGSIWEPSEEAKKKLETSRSDILRGEYDFFQMVQSMGLSLATEDLVYFSHWITPEILPKRFDTRFFLIEVSHHIEIKTDRSEVFDYLWITPKEAIEQGKKEILFLMSPTLITLEKLDSFSSSEQAKASLRGKEVSVILPKIDIRPDGSRLLVYPWDSKYENM